MQAMQLRPTGHGGEARNPFVDFLDLRDAFFAVAGVRSESGERDSGMGSERRRANHWLPGLLWAGHSAVHQLHRRGKGDELHGERIGNRVEDLFFRPRLRFERIGKHQFERSELFSCKYAAFDLRDSRAGGFPRTGHGRSPFFRGGLG